MLAVSSTAVLACVLLLTGGGPRDDRASAVPHTISARPHPFDPDWLEVELILQHKCTGCHRRQTKRHDLSSYEAILAAGQDTGMPSIVPGDPESSYLWEMVAWNAAAAIDSELPDEPMMPDDKHEWLTKGQLEVVYRWIQNGALQYVLPPGCNIRPLLEVDFPSARQCKQCHPQQYEEWSRSMHHYAQHSPVFEAFNLTLEERTGGTIGTFCSRCHTPLGTALGEDGLRRNIHRSRLSMEGVTCVVCHRQSEPFYKASGRQFIQPGQLVDECMYGPFDDPVTTQTGAHDAAARPYLKQSAFCGSCHDVLSPDGVRLEEAFSEWLNSPAAKQGITCQQCHMGPVQGQPIPEHRRPLGRAAVVPGVDPALIPLRPLSDHTFAGPDYSLLPDTEFPHKLDWMYETDYRRPECLTPHQQKTLQELRIRNRHQLATANSKRYELLRAAACIRVGAPKFAAVGDTIDVRVDVTSKVAGHSFPSGFTAERQVWVAVTVYDPCGRVVFCSGDLDENGDLRDSHSYAVEAGQIASDRHLLNFQNKFIALTTRGTERSIVLSVNRHLQPLNVVRPATRVSASYGRPPTFRLAKGSIPPLGTIGQNYPVHLPQAGTYVVDARLNFRHLPPVLLDEIGIPHLKHLLEIVVVDSARHVIHVGSASNAHGVPLISLETRPPLR